MKVLFFSDIHGITDNLKYIKELDNKEHFDKIVVLGDLYLTSNSSNLIIEINPTKVRDYLETMKNRLICLRGNCDSKFDMLDSPFKIIDNLYEEDFDGIRFYMTHGNEYNEFSNSFQNKKGVLIYGHFHRPYIIKKSEMTFICVGSISLPKNNSYPSYAIYENKKIVLYDIYNNELESTSL